MECGHQLRRTTGVAEDDRESEGAIGAKDFEKSLRDFPTSGVLKRRRNDSGENTPVNEKGSEKNPDKILFVAAFAAISGLAGQVRLLGRAER